jgi:hypothetical protein
MSFLRQFVVYGLGGSVLTICGRCDLNTWCSCVRMLTRRAVRYYATRLNS